MKTRSALIGFVLAVAISGTALASPTPSKPEARKAAVTKMNAYLRSNAWAKSGVVGKCSRVSMRRVDCKITIRGSARTCSLVARAKARRTILAQRHCRDAVTGSPGASKTIRLSAHLGKSPLRNLFDPFKATYDYGASSSVQQRGVEEPQSTAGVLALYVDGVLECAQNVNEANPSAECPVKHDELGTYRVTTIYTAGNESATDSMLYKLEPIPTSVSLSVSYEPLVVARYMGECGSADPCILEDGLFDNAGMMVGTLTITVGSVSPLSAVATTTCPFGLAGCISLPEGQPRTLAFPVIALADLIVHGDQDLVEDQLIDAEMQPPSSIEISGPGIPQIPVADIESGSRFFRSASGQNSGYASSEATAPIQFIPAATDTIVFR